MPAEVRALLGMFSLESLERGDRRRSPTAIRKRMLEVVDELERNGRSLQHFAASWRAISAICWWCEIAGGDRRRLVAASPAGAANAGARSPRSFSEEDLTRYLQLSLDLFRDLQISLQPRLHLEIGLLRLVQAGRLLPIEEALAALGAVRSALRPAPKPLRAETPAPKPRRSAVPAPAGDLRVAAARSAARGQADPLADAVEHSRGRRDGRRAACSRRRKCTSCILKEPEFEAAVQRVAGRPVKITHQGERRRSGRRGDRQSRRDRRNR